MNTYYFWLCDLVATVNRKNNYSFLLKDIYRTKFLWFVPNDDNRAFEGKNLRELFCKEEQLEYNLDEFDSDVSMLELIIALAIRCDDFMTDREDNVSINEWFWKLLTNVGLDNFTNDAYYILGGSKYVNLILDKIINRTYSRSGKGGLFPLKRPKKDQRKTELWYQMCHYLVENYYVDGAIA